MIIVMSIRFHGCSSFVSKSIEYHHLIADVIANHAIQYHMAQYVNINLWFTVSGN